MSSTESMPRLRRLGRRDDQGVATAVGTILILSALGLFVVYFNTFWVPTYVENGEASYAANLQTALLQWADKGEALVGLGATNEPFSSSMGLGNAGLPVLGSGASSGTVSTNSVPYFAIFSGTNATPLASASGALSIQTNTGQFPAQNLQYAGGGFEVIQGPSAWVNPRGMLSIARSSSIGGNNLTLSFNSMGIGTGYSTITSNGAVTIQGALASLATGSGPGGAVHLQITGVPAPAWRAGFNRTFQSTGLSVDSWKPVSGPGGGATACVSSVNNLCYDGNQNSPTTVDLWVLHVQPWSYRVGTAQVQFQT
jgi:hypothetical protein